MYSRQYTVEPAHTIPLSQPAHTIPHHSQPTQPLITASPHNPSSQPAHTIPLSQPAHTTPHDSQPTQSLCHSHPPHSMLNVICISHSGHTNQSQLLLAVFDILTILTFSIYMTCTCKKC
ncbi:hypothetical protein BsWGS_23667 [Bradybaena similaris]